ncbi:Conserved_hypothetical protein [Hexamita inflata]|uniref:Uncharacterized protein n=1 Tax=Hexamita inflata TaxID=28002 RepID=A0AA86TWB1_9EUKA|nr:Conserved hypothetical protein [Hexamita inflata]
MPKKCLCSQIPNIVRRLEALEDAEVQYEEDPNIIEREKYLNQFEASLEEAEQANKKKTEELVKVSNQVSSLSKEIKNLQAQVPVSKEQTEMLEQNQKILDTYTQTWQLTNQVFTQMYTQLQPLFALPDLKQSNIAMFEGIQHLGKGLLVMAQAIDSMKKQQEQGEEGEEEQEQQ